MRTIKFRAKSLHTGEWHYGDLIQPKDDAVFIQERGTAGFLSDPKTVGQFTGMLDKNGKEIYFDDIVSDKYGDIGSVVWCSDWTMRVDWGGGEIHFIDPHWGLEVIGNIHDNPELLKGGIK